MMTTLPWPFLVLIGALGLAIGSFLNVVIYRVPRGESVVHPGSHCPRCGAAIRTRHNVPVLGWLVLRGRCASCALPISPRYPVIEAVTGAAFAGVAYVAGPTVLLPLYLIAVPVVITVVMISWDARQGHSDASAVSALSAPHRRSS